MAVAAVLGFGLALLVDSSAFAQTPDYDCELPHCYSMGVQNSSFSGLEGQWDDRTMIMPASEINVGGHLTNEMWLATTGGQFIELGLARQCDVLVLAGETCSGNGGINAYMQFWGDEDTSGNIYFHWVQNIDQDGDSHSYEIWDSSDCDNDIYDIYIDYNYINDSTDQITCNGTQLNTGMELYAPSGINSGEYTDGDFYNYIETYSNSTGEWNYVDFSGTTSSVDTCSDNGYNCVMDPCSEFADGSCLHGLRESDYEWADSKPS